MSLDVGLLADQDTPVRKQNKDENGRVKILAPDFNPPCAHKKTPLPKIGKGGVAASAAGPLQPQEPPQEPELQLPPPSGLAAVMAKPER